MCHRYSAHCDVTARSMCGVLHLVFRERSRPKRGWGVRLCTIRIVVFWYCLSVRDNCWLVCEDQSRLLTLGPTMPLSTPHAKARQVPTQHYAFRVCPGDTELATMRTYQSFSLCVCVCQIKPDVMPRNTAFDQLGRLQSVCLATAVTNYLFTLNKSTLYSRQCRYTACFPLKALTRTSHRLHTQWIGTAVAHLTTAPAAWHQPHWILLSHWPGSTDLLSSHGGLPHCVISTSRRNELSYIYAKHNARIGITFCMLHYDDARTAYWSFLRKDHKSSHGLQHCYHTGR
jgi:hypothetical protein